MRGQGSGNRNQGNEGSVGSGMALHLVTNDIATTIADGIANNATVEIKAEVVDVAASARIDEAPAGDPTPKPC